MTREFLVNIDGQRISVAQSGDQLCVLDQQIRTSIVALRPNIYSLIVDGHSYLIHVGEGPNAPLTINGQTIHSEIISERSELILRYGQQKRIQEVVNELLAPMPGLIMQILVQAGEEVIQGQGLIVLEAMKMENELQAPRSGKIKHLHVQEKEAVARNAILIEFES